LLKKYFRVVFGGILGKKMNVGRVEIRINKVRE